MTRWLGDQLGLFQMALLFLTRLPVGAPPVYSDTAMARSARYFPAVGGIVGGISALIWVLASWVFPPVIAAMAAVTAGLFVTGALHEDGLADLADGLGGSADRARALEIMRDSRIGSYGALALILGLGLKIAALAGLPTEVGVLGLIAAHVVSRSVVVGVMASTSYARKTGAGQFARDGLTRATVAIAMVSGGLVVLILGFSLGWAGLIGAATAAAVGLAIRGLCQRRLGGYTGDVLGAIQQCTEIATLLGILACL